MFSFYLLNCHHLLLLLYLLLLLLWFFFLLLPYSTQRQSTCYYYPSLFSCTATKTIYRYSYIFYKVSMPVPSNMIIWFVACIRESKWLMCFKTDKHSSPILRPVSRSIASLLFPVRGMVFRAFPLCIRLWMRLNSPNHVVNYYFCYSFMRTFDFSHFFSIEYLNWSFLAFLPFLPPVRWVMRKHPNRSVVPYCKSLSRPLPPGFVLPPRVTVYLR